MSWLAALLLAVVGGALALLGPAVLRRVPEPDPPEPEDRADPPGEPAPVLARGTDAPKVPYAALAESRRLLPGLVVVSAALGALVGWQIGWNGYLLTWAYLVPVGVLLGYTDWRTRFLPTGVIAPSYGVLVVLVLGTWLVEGDVHVLLRAALGWAVLGGFYFVVWFLNPGGMGYGDVRLSGLLGLALGPLGTAPVFVALLSGTLLGALAGLVLRLARGERHVPYGPFLLLGALVGVLLGLPVGSGLGY